VSIRRTSASLPEDDEQKSPVVPTPSQLSTSLTAILRTLAALSTTLASLLAQETTAHDRQARHQTSAVLLLLGRRLLWRRLLVAHGRLLVAILLRWGWAVARLLLVLAWGRAVRLLRLLGVLRWSLIVVALAGHFCLRSRWVDAIGVGCCSCLNRLGVRFSSSMRSVG